MTEIVIFILVYIILGMIATTLLAMLCKKESIMLIEMWLYIFTWPVILVASICRYIRTGKI